MAKALKGRFDPDSGLYKAGTQEVRHYLQRHLARVEGYLSSRDGTSFAFVDDLQRANNIRGDLVDIGAWRGRATLLMASMARADEKVFAIDLFDLRDPSHKQFNDPAILQNNTAELGVADKVVMVKADTVADRTKIVQALGQSRPRLIYVDGGHDYTVARNDISLALDAVADNGVIACNDYLSPTHPAVTEALIEEVKSRGQEFCAFMLNPKRVWLCKRKMHALYYSQARDTFTTATRSPKLFGANARLVLWDKQMRKQPQIGLDIPAEPAGNPHDGVS